MKEKLFSRNYVAILIANFLLTFGFWLQMPIMPFYLADEFETSKATAGMVISCYTISALIMRAFSGYLLDTFNRKPLYLIAFFIFANVFTGYWAATNLAIFCVMRILHGLAYGLAIVGGNTIVIDVMPSSRRGEGIGYYGLANNLSMALGPLVGVLLSNMASNYKSVFLAGLFCCMLGFLIATTVKTKPRQKVKRQAISLDRFILIKGIPAGVALALLAIPYGITTNYIMMYAKETGLEKNADLFFIVMACGMALARVFSGKMVDKGYITKSINFGVIFIILCYILLPFIPTIYSTSHYMTKIIYFVCATLNGIGFGIIFPAYNSLFVSLAPKNRRGTATSTYLTSWDVGLGIGITCGGITAQHFGGFATAYFAGAATSIISAIYFAVYVAQHFNKNKLELQ